MTEPSYVATYERIARFKTPRALVLTLIPQHLDKLEPLRKFLAEDPRTLDSGVRTIASNLGAWNRHVNEARTYRSSRTSPEARRAICDAIVTRVLRTPHGATDDAYMTRARMVTALIGLHQLRALAWDEPVTRPYIHLRNLAAILGTDPGGKTAKRRIDDAVKRRMLVCVELSAKRRPGKWVVRPLGKRDAPLTPVEGAISEALAGPQGDAFEKRGIWNSVAADILLQSEHPLFHYDRQFGAEAWLAVLRAEARLNTQTPEREALAYRIRNASSLDVLLSAEAAEAHALRQIERDAEKLAEKASTVASREGSDLVWRYLHGRFDWRSVTDATLPEWTAQTLARVDAALNAEGLTEDQLAELTVLASSIRPTLTKAISRSRRFPSSENVSAVLTILKRKAA